MEKETSLKLNPNYSYARIYKKGDVLHKHKDRFSCEISTTMHLGGGCWPIYLEPDASLGGVDEKTGNYKASKSKPFIPSSSGLPPKVSTTVIFEVSLVKIFSNNQHVALLPEKF